jgi:hypothetical protein
MTSLARLLLKRGVNDFGFAFISYSDKSVRVGAWEKLRHLKKVWLAYGVVDIPLF